MSQALINRICFLFGPWHAMKQAATDVWRTFHHTLIAPAFHSLFPHRLCIAAPKLSLILSFFSYLHYVYPHIRSTLNKAIATAISTGSEYATDLKNMRDFFQFYIPIVCN